MSSSASRVIDNLLAHHHHLLTPAQAKAAGVHRSSIARLVRGGVLEPVLPTVYGRVGVPFTWERRLLAVLLRAGPHARASHRAAARMLGIPTYECAPVEITIPSKRHFDVPGVIAHQSRDLQYLPPMIVDGIPCTPPRRLAVDIGAVLGETAYTTVIRDLRREHGVTWKQLAAVLDLHSRRGRNGCGPLRRQLERYYGVAGIPESTLEQQFLDDLIDSGYPLPECQYPVASPGDRPFRIDFAYVEVHLGVEIDGPHHRDPEVQARDQRRDAYLRSLGWEILRFDEDTVMFAPTAVLYGLRQALERLGAWPESAMTP